MKVCVVIPSFYPAVIYGGPIYSSLNACEHLAQRKSISIIVVTTDANGDETLNVNKNKWIRHNRSMIIRYCKESLREKISLPFVSSVNRAIRTCSVVHLQSLFNYPTPITLLFASYHSKPVLLSPRGQLSRWAMAQGSRFKKIWLLALIKPFAHTVSWHVTSEQEKVDVLRFFPKAHIYIVSNGIDNRGLTLNEAVIIQQKRKNDEKVIISVARLHRVKGLDILIRAIPKIIHQYNVRLLIIGPDGGDLTRLKGITEELEITNFVTFLGAIIGTEKNKLVASADVFVLPSYSENFGNVYLESLALGTPIIASTATPWAIVEKYKCGRWVDNTVEATANAILDLLSRDPAMLKKASLTLSKCFGWELIAEQYELVYRTLVKEKAGLYKRND